MTPNDDIQDFGLTCEGGLDLQNPDLLLSSTAPGAATRLVNFEPGLYGGYRRINGYEKLSDTYGEVDSANAEGRILGLMIFDGEIYAARKLQSGTTYGVYRFDSGSGWVQQTTGLTHNTTDGTVTIKRIRYRVVNFDGTETLVFVDGVNNASMFDGTNWTQISSSNDGSSFANAGGDQALDKPSTIEVFENHLFLSGDYTAPSVVCHAAPSSKIEFDTASGGGQIVVGYTTNGIRLWRDQLIVFGRENIGRIFVQSTDFLYKDISSKLGCVSPGSIIEVNGDLMFLSQDGFRPIAGTDKINDFELNTLSKKIQRLVKELSDTYTLDDVSSVVITQKSQVRFFFNSESVEASNTRGILGAYRESIEGGMSWEWGEIRGFSAFTTASGWIGNNEYILHGDYDGIVYRQERGSDFDGADILAVYQTPYLDLSSPMINKIIRNLYLFVEAEGTATISTRITFNWGDTDSVNPAAYSLESASGAGATYGTAIYGTSVYGSSSFPVLNSALQGYFQSVRFTFTTNGTESPYAIKNLIGEYTSTGRRKK